MVAGDFRGGGSVTLPATGPGETATVTESVGSLVTGDIVIVTISAATTAQDLGDRFKDIKFQVVKTAGQFVLSTNAQQTPELDLDYLVITTA